MPTALPVELDPFRQAEQGNRFSGRIEVRRLPRLASMLASDRGGVEVDLRFERDMQGTAIIAGRAEARVELICQRCLGPMPVTLEARFRLAVVRSEAEAKRLPTGLEPLVLADGALSPSEMVEDELILSMPLVPRHPGSACQLHGEWESTEDQAAWACETSPFSVLKDLKKH